MDINELQLKLEELEISPTKIDEILSSAQDWEEDKRGTTGQISTESLEIMREYETDWRKKAIIAAEIIKRGLDN